MIRLIVTDMDGCLLDGAGKLPPDFRRAYGLIREKDVVFAAASGRSLDGLKKPFGEFADGMTFITDNGARVFHRGELLFQEALDPEDVRPALEEIRRIDGLVCLACGEEKIWTEQPERITGWAEQEIRKYYPVLHECDLTDVPEAVIKFAILYSGDIEKDIYPGLKQFDNERLRVQVTSFPWIDIYAKNVSKGSGVGKLREKLGILSSETAVFGDYLNDLSMADYADHSYAPANAHPEVLKRYTEVIRPNTEYGVTAKMIELLEQA